MSSYPTTLDSDSTIFRIDDNLSELGGEVINQIREAIFAIEGELGLSPAGSVGSVVNRLNVSLNADGTIKTSALSAAGLITLPIDNAQIGSSAGIKESKLDLDYSTSSLHTRLAAAEVLLSSLATFTAAINSNLRVHVAGGTQFLDGTLARHVASHIDLNAVPSDSRDTSYIWSGLQDKDGNNRSATTVAEALDEINTDLINHENAIIEAHPATAITVDTSNFLELTADANTAQKALEELDNAETLRMGLHRSTMHDNGVNRTARAPIVGGTDGYSQNIVPPTLARAFHIESPATGPVDNNVTGDDLIAFMPTNTNFVFDSQFAQVKPGDIIRINYGTGFEGVFTIDEIRHNTNTEWVVRINNINLCSTDGYTCFARIDRPLFTDNTAGVFACASANNDIDGNILSSVIIGNPRGAMALGNGFEPSQLDGYHYNLYLALYPTGDPSEKTHNLPAIDVTGNQGATPGYYTLEKIVQTTNDGLRAAGYNYRFIAFSHNGNFGIMLADVVDNASFSIISGTVSGTSIIEGSYTNNVVGDVVDGRDAFGLGGSNAAWASPEFSGSFTNDGSAVNFYTKVIPPLKSRNTIINGVRRDDFPETYGEIGDGYWSAEITNRVVISTTTVEVTYTVDRDLSNSSLLPGKTIVVAPTVDVNDGSYLVQDYGRFVIKNVTYTLPCGDIGAQTLITVVNGIHGTGDPDDSSSAAGLAVRLYFSDDSVSFNQSNVIDAVVSSQDFLRVHEIFLDEEAHSFSHERARMNKQSGTGSLLETAIGWSFRRVSEKLQGFRDSETSTDFHRYVRMYIVNYDSATGEYDGYIGKRVVGSDTLTKFGRITRARKGIPARLYDHTNIDYIEVQFNETGSSSTSISYPRYVDIEIFPTLLTNDEYFKLASVETNEKSIVNIVDEREFGTISEKNFSTSAIKFIESGDRLLHGNGVFYGLDCLGSDSADSGSGLLFNGGSALINGKVVTANNAKVNIPIVDASSVINFAICLNKDGNFISVILSDYYLWPDFANSRQEVFVTDESATNTYLIRSSTLEELVYTETDLVPLAVVEVAFGLPISINSISDARRFVTKETNHISLVWAENDNTHNQREGFVTAGHFTSFEQVKTWISNTDHRSYLIRLKGEIDISSAIDFTEITTVSGGDDFKRIVLEGSEGSTVYVTSDIGFKLTSYMHLRNISFRYQADVPISSGTLHLDNDSGCLYADSSNLAGLIVENCTFRSENISAERFPFMNFKVVGTWYDILIKNNKFFGLSGADSRNCIIGFSPLTVSSPVLSSCIIEGNWADRDQIIALVNNYDRGDTTSGGLICSGVVIKNNYLSNGSATGGSIGYQIRSATYGLEDSLIIKDNNCNAIMFMDQEGNFVGDFGVYTPNNVDYPNGSGKVIIEGNTCSTVSVIQVSDGPGSSIRIVNNNISLTTAGNLTTYLGFDAGLVCGILLFQLFTNTSVSTSYVAQINNNNINGLGASSTYDYGIRVSNCNAIITGNAIHGFTFHGIHNLHGAFGLDDGYSIIKDNIIFREGQSVTSYITTDDARSIIKDNIFDSLTIDGASTATIDHGDGVSVVGNVNDLQSRRLNIDPGGFDNIIPAVDTGKISSITYNYVATYNRRMTIFSVVGGAGSFSMNWQRYISELIPPGAILKQMDIRVAVATTSSWSSGNITLEIFSGAASAVVDQSSTLDISTTTSAILSLTALNYNYNSDYIIRLTCSTLACSTTDTLYIAPIFITYTF